MAIVACLDSYARVGRQVGVDSRDLGIYVIADTSLPLVFGGSLVPYCNNVFPLWVATPFMSLDHEFLV